MTPDQILAHIYGQAAANLDRPLIEDPEILQNIALVSRNISNRAGVRVLLACTLAKVHNDAVDVRKPYTEIGDADTFSGRKYDETYITAFIVQHELPCNPTTAFLTPALRNRNTVLTPDLNLSGRPKEVYKALLELLQNVYEQKVTARQLLGETIRQLILFRDEKKRRMESLISALKSKQGDVPLAAEQIITIIEQHLATKTASRLPVLIVAAAYAAARPYLRERALRLEGHNAADSQTHALGDLQITLEDDAKVVTCYEMKMKRVTANDIDLAVQQKLAQTEHGVENYIFITTETITPEVTEHAKSMYELIGVEIVVLDCVGFLRHFLHLFYRQRMAFLDAYQALVLAEPESAVSQPLKEVFLTLRQAAESDQTL
ncbi:MAG: restriction endonuclease, SacI family [Chloroflexi bacterium]|nr:restriction endonuclease, SacI family [Chloroflexota bacterium]